MSIYFDAASVLPTNPSADSTIVAPLASTDGHKILQQQIDLSLQKAQAQKQKLKKTDQRYSITHIILSALAAFITGQSAVSGKAMIVDWKVTTAIASLLGFSTTLVAGIQKQLVSSDLLEESSECVARLKALKIETLTPTYNVETVSTTYQQLLAEYSNIDI